MLASVRFATLHPVGDAGPRALGTPARLLENRPEPVEIVADRSVGIGADVRGAAPYVHATEDPVVLARVHPFRQRGSPPHGVGMRRLPLCCETKQSIPARVPLLVLRSLLQERVQI